MPSVLVLTIANRYYQPWLAAYGSAANVASNVDSISAADLQDSGYRPRSSRDRALTAFAQLATLRLNVRRAMVSLIDTKHQYILTEATRTVSLISEARHEEDDGLWLGNTVLNREDAVCHNCFTNTYTTKDRNGLPVSIRGFVVPDCREDDRLNHLSNVQAEPGVRFYAGIPIVTRSGHAIGVYAVSDEYPREGGLSLEDMRFMQDIATAVLEHLEWARDRVDRFQGERILRGLASFIDCSSSYRYQPTGSLVDGTGEYSYEEDAAAENDSYGEGLRSYRPGGCPLPYMPSKRALMSDTASDAESTMSAGSTNPTKGSRRKRPRDAPENYVDVVYGRAARILRKATLADGVAFFGPNGELGSHAVLSPADENKKLDQAPPPREDVPHALCQLLGASIGKSTDKQSLSKPSLSAKALQQYFKAYPDGKTLNFSTKGMGLNPGEDSSSDAHDSHGSNIPGGASQNEANGSEPRKGRLRRKEGRISHAELLERLPGVRTITFLPLRDNITGKWIAGGFLWTSTAGRMMDLTSDFSYLGAFINSISGEISRANMAKLDRAKTTFIASMSHELRSPLHGILGSVEFLQDTVTDAYQTGLVSSIANCSRTLLDTLSNLLSYAKVTTMETPDIAADDVDLGQVVEEVVEAVCAGHTFKQLHTNNLASDAQDSSIAKVLHNAARYSVVKLHSDDIERAAKESSQEGTVCVLLDLQPSVSWNVSTNPGALRRIIMNLVGNALKYTTDGFVAVSFRAQQVNDKLETTFRVVDSGKGISEEFQRDHLFTPFKQEDTFASGTGLGLSIVKQLVESLGGSIQLHSVVDQGTEIEVKLCFDLNSKAISSPDESMIETAARTKSLRLCLLDPNEEKERPESDHIARLDKTISETCASWFGMEITKADNLINANTDMFLYTEPPSLEYLLEHHGEQNGNQKTPLIIICMNATEAIAVSQNQIKRLSELGSIVEVVPQPCGPRKLAKILNHCLDRVEKAKKENTSVSTGTGNGKNNGSESRELGKDQIRIPQDLGLQIAPASTAENGEEPRSDKENLLDKVKLQYIPLSAAAAFPDRQQGSEKNNEASPMSSRTMSSQNLDEAPQRKADFSQSQPLHVLVVDDNKINVDLLVKFVQKFKLTCQEAYNGKEAVEKFKQAHAEQRRFDYILMDISMPIMDGIEATRTIREFEGNNHLERTPIFALSAFASTDIQHEAKSNGVDIYLPKPVKFGQLKKLLLEKQQPS